MILKGGCGWLQHIFDFDPKLQNKPTVGSRCQCKKTVYDHDGSVRYLPENARLLVPKPKCQVCEKIRNIGPHNKVCAACGRVLKNETSKT